MRWCTESPRCELGCRCTEAAGFQGTQNLACPQPYLQVGVLLDRAPAPHEGSVPLHISSSQRGQQLHRWQVASAQWLRLIAFAGGHSGCCQLQQGACACASCGAAAGQAASLHPKPESRPNASLHKGSAPQSPPAAAGWQRSRACWGAVSCLGGPWVHCRPAAPAGAWAPKPARHLPHPSWWPAGGLHPWRWAAHLGRSCLLPRWSSPRARWCRAGAGGAGPPCWLPEAQRSALWWLPARSRQPASGGPRGRIQGREVQRPGPPGRR